MVKQLIADNAYKQQFLSCCCSCVYVCYVSIADGLSRFAHTEFDSSASQQSLMKKEQSYAQTFKNVTTIYISDPTQNPKRVVVLYISKQ